jgi:phage I-like protein
MPAPETTSPELVQLDAQAIELVELADGGRKLPTEICLFRKGVTETTKGQFVCDATAAKFTIDNVKAHYGDALTNFDYGHGQVGFVSSYDSARSAGWAKLTERDGALWATEIEWTPTAQKALLDREFRFFSPTVYRDPETRRLTNLVNVALTNLPATKGQKPIVNSLTGDHMSAPQAPAPSAAESPSNATPDLAALQASNAQLLSAVQQLQASNSALQAQLSAQVAEKAKADKAAFIAKLSQDGKLPPALQSWALGQDIAVLEAFAKDAPVIASPGASAPPAAPTSSVASLSAEEKEVARQMGLSEADILSTRNHLSSSANFWAFDPLSMAPVAAK